MLDINNFDTFKMYRKDTAGAITDLILLDNSLEDGWSPKNHDESFTSKQTADGGPYNATVKYSDNLVTINFEGFMDSGYAQLLETFRGKVGYFNDPDGEHKVRFLRIYRNKFPITDMHLIGIEMQVIQ